MPRVLPEGRLGVALGPGVEFDRIRAIARLLGELAPGIGDDCGFLAVGDETLAVSTDISVDQVHFRLDWISLKEVGWRATAAALSDLAAVAAESMGLVTAVTMPAGAVEADLLELMAGVGSAAASGGALVLGGDLSRGAAWSIAVTVIGRTHTPITRAGARPGDRLWVTGTLGGARAALEAWRRGEQPSQDSRRKFAQPEPRLAAARWLARQGAHAMIDLSDGLAGDAGHIAAASKVKLNIDLAALPVTTAAAAEAARDHQVPGTFAAEAGEDYELLVVMPPQFDAVNAFVQDCGIALTAIGSVEKGAGASFLLNGRPAELRGYDHFG